MGPFYLYGWCADAQISGFDGKVSALLNAGQDAAVVKTAIMFSSYTNLAAKIDQIPDGIDGVFYNSEPSLSVDYNDIFLEGESNSVVKFARLAESHGLESHWGPMRRNFEPSVGDHVSETAIALMFEAGLDGIGLQEQQQIDDICVQNIVYGPNQIGGRNVESISEVVSRLQTLTDRDFEVDVQVMPGYQYTEGCYPGDAYAEANCGTHIDHTYRHCENFALELEQAGLVDSLALWASQPTERAQLVPLIETLR